MYQKGSFLPNLDSRELGLFFPPRGIFAYLNPSGSGMHLPTSWTRESMPAATTPSLWLYYFCLPAYNLSKSTRLTGNGAGPQAIKEPINGHIVCVAPWRLGTDQRCHLPQVLVPRPHSSLPPALTALRPPASSPQLYPATVFLNFLICLHCVKCHHSPPSSPPDLDSLPPNGSASCLHRISMHSLLGPCLGPWYHHPQQCTWIRNLGIILNSSPLTTHPHHHIGWSRNCTDCAFWNSFTILITSLTVQGPSFLAYLQESPSLTQCPQCPTLYPIIGTARAYLKCSSSPPTHKVQGPRQGSYGHHLTPTCLFRPISCANPV